MIGCDPYAVLGRKTLATGASDHGIGVADLESALLQVLGIIELAAADEESAFRVDDHIHPVAGNKDVAVAWAIHQVHLVLQAGATATDDSDAQGTLGTPLALQQTRQMPGGPIHHSDEFLVADFVVHGVCHGLGGIWPQIRLASMTAQETKKGRPGKGAAL